MRRASTFSNDTTVISYFNFNIINIIIVTDCFVARKYFQNTFYFNFVSWAYSKISSQQTPLTNGLFSKEPMKWCSNSHNKTCINCKWWLYFSFIISELNIFIFFRHYNLLFDISFKAVFNFNISSILKACKQKCQKSFFYDYAWMYWNFL